MSDTITDNDGTALPLDEAVIALLYRRHPVCAEPRDNNKWYALGRHDVRVYLPSVTIIALVIDTLKTLVRETYPDATVMAQVRPALGDQLWWRVCYRNSGGPVVPTELQAWHAAYEAVKALKEASS